MEDILDVYKSPYDSRFLVICMDESSKQHEKAKLKNLPAKPGQLEHYDTCYERDGIRNVFLNVEPLTGRRWVDIAERRTRLDGAKPIQR